MKALYLPIIFCLCISKLIAQPASKLSEAGLIKVTEIEEPYIDSLEGFKTALYRDIKHIIENKATRYLEQFSICIKTDNQGNLDTVMVSDNVDLQLKQHFWKSQKQSVYDNLITYTKKKGWNDTYVVLTVMLLYEEAKPPTLGDLITHQKNLQLTYSFNSRSLLQHVQPIRLLDPPLVLFFGRSMR